MLPTIVFGHQPFASWVVETLEGSDLYDVRAVVSEQSDKDFSHHGLPYEQLAKHAHGRGIEVVRPTDLPSFLEDQQTSFFGFLARYGRIIPETVIRAFDFGILNCHGGLLPSWRGVNISNHVILEGAAESGATLHYIDAGVDTGPILDRYAFELSPHDTAYDVYLKTQGALMSLVDRNLGRLATGRSDAIKQYDVIDQEPVRTFRQRDLDALRNVPASASLAQLHRTARAFEFPGRERAYIETDGGRVYLTTESMPSSKPPRRQP